MEDKPRVLMIITADTKENEARFLRKCLEDDGLAVYHLDPSVRDSVDCGADITPEQVAAAAGKTIEEVRALKHEAKCLAVMIEGSVKCAHELHSRVGLSGIIAAGGALGTSLGAALMQTFPLGLPKIMVSTMASGMTRSLKPIERLSPAAPGGSVCTL